MGGSHPRYSPDGVWWWDGTSWMPAAEISARKKPGYVAPPEPSAPAPPPAPARGVRGWQVALAAVLVAVVGGVGLLVWSRLGPASSGVQGRPTTSLVAALTARGLDCSQVPNVTAARVWACMRDTSPSYEYVVAQYGDNGQLAHIEAKVDRLGLNPGAYDSRGQASSLYQALIGASLQSGQGGPLLSWVRSAVKAGGGSTSQGDLTADVSTYRSDLVKLVIGVRGVTRAKLAQSLPRITAEQGQGFVQSNGFSCRPETGFLYCQMDQPAVYGDAAFFRDAGSAVSGVNLLVHAQGDGTQDVTSQVDEWFPAAIGLVLQGDDAAKGARWVADHLGKAWHMAVIGGVKLEMYGFRPESWGPTGIWGMRMEIATVDWP